MIIKTQLLITKQIMQKFFLLFFSVCFYCLKTKAQELITYPVPQAVVYSMHNDDYTVKVRKPGGEWQDLYEYNVKVDLDKPQDASMVYFDFSGSVEVFVQKNNGNAHSVKIRPSSYEIKPTLNGNSITFTLTEPKKISIEFDGDKLHNLHLFANSVETFRPDPNDPNVVYFGPGVHVPKDLPGNAFNIGSGKTVYIAGGAIVRGKLFCDKVQNVRIIGRGIIDQPERGVEIRHSSNVTVDGIIVVNPKHYTIFKEKIFNYLTCLFRVSMNTDVNGMCYISPENRIGNRIIFCITIEFPAMPIHGDAIIGVAHKHIIDRNITATHKIQPVTP